MAKVLQHDDISKLYYRENKLKAILPEIALDMQRLIKQYPNCLHDASFLYSDFSYSSILLVEHNFVRRFVGPHKIEITKPLTKAKEWFARKFIELANCLPQFHSEHSGGINDTEYKKINELATATRQLNQVEKSMSELRILIPTIQIVVHDEYDGLYS